MTTVYTIGFTQKPAARFFGLLHEHNVGRLLDTRLRPTGQLSGFAKQGDLAYFLAALIDCDYRHMPELAPTDDLLAAYRHDKDWAAYARSFDLLLEERQIPQALDRHAFDEKVCCLLCSEARPDKCHRRLVGERLAQHWPDMRIVHLV